MVSTGITQQPGPALPAGGSVGQLLTKKSAADGDASWALAPGAAPAQVFLSGSWYDNRWIWPGSNYYSPTATAAVPLLGWVCVPVFLPRAVTVDMLAVNVSGNGASATAAGNTWAGVYPALADGSPATAPLFSGTSTVTASFTGNYGVPVSGAIPAGWSYLMFGAAGSLYAVGNPLYLFRSPWFNQPGAVPGTTGAAFHAVWGFSSATAAADNVTVPAWQANNSQYAPIISYHAV